MSPRYDFKCEGCSEEFELDVAYEDRDADRKHKACTGNVRRLFVSAPKAREKTRYGGMQAVIVDRNERKVGHAKGHFGKTAARKRRK